MLNFQVVGDTTGLFSLKSRREREEELQQKSSLDIFGSFQGSDCWEETKKQTKQNNAKQKGSLYL